MSHSFSINRGLAHTSHQKMHGVQMPCQKDRTRHKNVHTACMLNKSRELLLPHHDMRIPCPGFIVSVRVLSILLSNDSTKTIILPDIMTNSIPIQTNYDGQLLICHPDTQKLILLKGYTLFVVLATRNPDMVSLYTSSCATLPCQIGPFTTVTVTFW